MLWDCVDCVGGCLIWLRRGWFMVQGYGRLVGLDSVAALVACLKLLFWCLVYVVLLPVTVVLLRFSFGVYGLRVGCCLRFALVCFSVWLLLIVVCGLFGLLGFCC